ncbi:hypothetical protein GCM10009547_34960 [Sporichthya brevicatena]|uniref:Uncharacterized protein n=1 Tax=Sporichthya brevicatena TaxID=171442 RepID=A0ABN1H3U5_9ACTN
MTPLIILDEEYDRTFSSDGASRLGGYLRQRVHLFADDWEPLSPVLYAATVWGIATAPVMTPPYARVSSAVWGIDCRHADEPGVLAVTLDVRIPWPRDHRDDDTLRGWADWCRIRCWDRTLDQLVEPGDDRRAALFVARLRVPIAEDYLPIPDRFNTADTLVAKCAIAAIADEVNGVAGPVVAMLRELDAAGAGR